jgi:hypothetical protein
MIKILEPKKSKKEREPYYLLVYDYMIGDANGNITEEVRLSKDNPFIERYVTLLNQLKPTKGTWGIILDSGRLYDFLDEKQITQEDYDFLNRLMFECWDEDIDEEDEPSTFTPTEEEIDYTLEFYEGIRSEAEYSFLVFEGCTLYYYDNFGVKHKTKFVN